MSRRDFPVSNTVDKVNKVDKDPPDYSLNPLNPLNPRESGSQKAHMNEVHTESAQEVFNEVTSIRMNDHAMPESEAMRESYKTPFGEERRQARIEEASKLYRERGWVQIYSGYLGASIYLVKNESVLTPDPAIKRYTENEVMALAGLNPDEVRTMHDAKVIYKGTICNSTVMEKIATMS